jgi:cytochrome b subunit of formate dehydrogenase
MADARRQSRIGCGNFRSLRPAIVWLQVLAWVTMALAVCAPIWGQEIAREDEDACMACHGTAMDKVGAVDRKALSQSPHASLKCQDCHSSITAAPHTKEMLSQKAACGTCHPEPLSAYIESVHSRPDKVEGDHPTCRSCHARGADPHAVLKQTWTRRQSTIVCGRCHGENARMARYGVDPDASKSYHESFHGKALMRFDLTKAAGCVDCHRNHDVLSPGDPSAPTHRSNAAAMCAAKDCHPGAKVNFAMSGANHLRLKVKQSTILHLEELFFRWLTAGTMLFLIGGVALDLRARVFTRQAVPASGRAAAALVAASFLALIGSLGMAFVGFGRPRWVGVAAIILMVAAILVYAVTRKRSAPQPEKTYARLDLNHRLQHIALFVSFIALALTGLPLRFAHHPWLNALYELMGGISGARAIHRGAAVVMIVAWVWHSLDLLLRWKRAGFRLSSWTMVPTLKDVRDFLDLSRYYLGMAKEPPKFDRFEFRQKFDYFAVYWGMPIMVFSGLVLWFPIVFGNLLPEIGVSAAYIAHSDEAILAFLAIAVWHFYNVHFNPGDFPMSYAWLTGKKTRSQMEHEHPLELERIEKGGDPRPS